MYSWIEPERGPVQIPGNLSLPGGFKLGGYGNQYCDVKTATGGYLGKVSKTSRGGVPHFWGGMVHFHDF